MLGGWGWHGVEGSDLATEGCSGIVSGSGFDLVACRGLSATLGLAGRVCVPGMSWRELGVGLRELGVGVGLRELGAGVGWRELGLGVGWRELGVGVRAPVRFGCG